MNHPAGRNLGLALGAFSIYATWFGSETVLGAAGRVYEKGLAGAQAEPFAYAVGIVLMGAVFAVPLWRRGLITFADLFRQRFSPGVERLAVLLLVPGSVLWVAAQIRGFGQIMSEIAGFELVTAMVLGVVVVIVYASLGGLLADAYSDLIQGVVIITGLLALLVAAVNAAGGPENALAAVPPGRLVFFGREQTPLSFLEEWAVPVCGSIVAIELVSRVLACRSAEVARQAAVTGGLVYLTVAGIPVVLGLLGPNLAPPCPVTATAAAGCVADVERLTLVLSTKLLSPVFQAIFIGALVAAIISTVDSTLVACSAMVSHNLVQPMRPIVDERRRLWLVRGLVVALGIIALGLALRSRRISDLVETASAFASAGIFVAAVLGLFTRLGGPASAYGAIIAGALVWAVGKFALGWSTPYVAGLLAAFIAYLALANVGGGASAVTSERR